MNVTQPEKLPNRVHFAALVFETKIIYHEGDVRSREYPGHGYPEYTENISTVNYIEFGSQAEMEDWVIKAETKQYDKPKYRLIEARPLSAKVSAVVNVNIA